MSLPRLSRQKENGATPQPQPMPLFTSLPKLPAMITPLLASSAFGLDPSSSHDDVQQLDFVPLPNENNPTRSVRLYSSEMFSESTSDDDNNNNNHYEIPTKRYMNIRVQMHIRVQMMRGKMTTMEDLVGPEEVEWGGEQQGRREVDAYSRAIVHPRGIGDTTAGRDWRDQQLGPRSYYPHANFYPKQRAIDPVAGVRSTTPNTDGGIFGPLQRKVAVDIPGGGGDRILDEISYKDDKSALDVSHYVPMGELPFVLGGAMSGSITQDWSPASGEIMADSSPSVAAMYAGIGIGLLIIIFVVGRGHRDRAAPKTNRHRRFVRPRLKVATLSGNFLMPLPSNPSSKYRRSAPRVLALATTFLVLLLVPAITGSYVHKIWMV